MKHLLKIVLGLVLCLGLFTACDDEEDNAAVSGFSLSKTEVAANAEGGKETVTVSSEGEWVAKSSEPWLSGIVHVIHACSARCCMVMIMRAVIWIFWLSQRKAQPCLI